MIEFLKKYYKQIIFIGALLLCFIVLYMIIQNIKAYIITVISGLVIIASGTKIMLSGEKIKKLKEKEKEINNEIKDNSNLSNDADDLISEYKRRGNNKTKN